MILQSLGLEAVFKDGEAQIQNFRIGFDPDDFINVAGSAGMADPFPFSGKGAVNFKNVAVLNDIVRNLGIEPGLSGEIHANFTGSGDLHRPDGRSSRFRAPNCSTADLLCKT